MTRFEEPLNTCSKTEVLRSITCGLPYDQLSPHAPRGKRISAVCLPRPLSEISRARAQIGSLALSPTPLSQRCIPLGPKLEEAVASGFLESCQAVAEDLQHTYIFPSWEFLLAKLLAHLDFALDKCLRMRYYTSNGQATVSPSYLLKNSDPLCASPTLLAATLLTGRLTHVPSDALAKPFEFCIHEISARKPFVICIYVSRACKAFIICIYKNTGGYTLADSAAAIASKIIRGELGEGVWGGFLEPC